MGATFRTGNLLPGLVITTIVVLASLTCPADGAETAVDFVEPRIGRQQFADFIRRFDLQHEQRMIIELAYEDYLDTVNDIIVAADRRAEQAGRKKIDLALSGASRLEPDELRQLRVDVLNSYRASWPEADEAVERFLDGLPAVLDDGQRVKFDDAVRKLRRQMLLHPMQAARNSYEYAGDGVDVILLAEQASQEGGELDGLDHKTAETVANTLDSYAVQLDQLLTESYSASRAARLDGRIARILRDERKVTEANRQLMEQWKRLYQLNRRTVNNISAVLREEKGQEAAQQWMRRFDEATFVWLFRDRTPDRQYQWIVKQDLPQETRTQVTEIYQQYRKQRLELAHKAIDIMIQARMEQGFPLHAMVEVAELNDRRTQQLYENLLRNTGEQASLDSDAADSLEAALPERMRTHLRRAVR